VIDVGLRAVREPPAILGRRLQPVVAGAQRLQIRRLVAAAVDLRHDVVDAGRGAPAGSGIRRSPPLAGRIGDERFVPSIARSRDIVMA